MKPQMNLARHRPYPLPSPTAAVAIARELLRRSTPASQRPPVRPAVVWTPLEPSGYVRIGRRLVPARWSGPGDAPAVGEIVDLCSSVISVTASGRSTAPLPGTYGHLHGAQANDSC